MIGTYLSWTEKVRISQIQKRVGSTRQVKGTACAKAQRKESRAWNEVGVRTRAKSHSGL